MVPLAPKQLRIETAEAHRPTAQQLAGFVYPPISMWLQSPISTPTGILSRHSASLFTMLFGKRWIVHLDLIPCSQVSTHTHWQDEIACYLNLIIYTWDAVTSCTPVTTWGAVMLKKIKVLTCYFEGHVE